MSTNYTTHAPVKTWEDCAAVMRHFHTLCSDHIAITSRADDESQCC